MYKRYLTTVIFVLGVSFSLLYIYRRPEIIIPLADDGLQLFIDYLNHLRSYVGQQVFQPIQLNLETETFEATTNYSLSQYKEQCPDHRYIIRIIERRPMVIYIEQFLTQNEIQHLIQLTEPIFAPSMVYDDNGERSQNQLRTSSTANIKRALTPVVKCIEERAARFQGDIDVHRIEPLQVVKYRTDQQYRAHYDWFAHSDMIRNGGQRVSTFFTYLEANCSLGETEFLDIPFNLSAHERFCDILICDEKSLESGLRFRPIPGNSIFWFNVDEHGQVDYLTYHAGRPPGENGHKIGLNTWTHEDIWVASTDKQ